MSGCFWCCVGVIFDVIGGYGVVSVGDWIIVGCLVLFFCFMSGVGVYCVECDLDYFFCCVVWFVDCVVGWVGEIVFVVCWIWCCGNWYDVCIDSVGVLCVIVVGVWCGCWV